MIADAQIIGPLWLVVMRQRIVGVVCAVFVDVGEVAKFEGGEPDHHQAPKRIDRYLSISSPQALLARLQSAGPRG